MDDNDHRRLAAQLDLFHFQEEAPGMVFWHPRGLCLYRLLEDAVRQQMQAQGYHEVKTPQILRRAVWEASGHWQHFHDGMFHLDDQRCDAALKPVSCPGHIAIVRQRTPSHRELPIRLGELGVVHRDESGGSLHGLLRLRQFTQDDGHVFCTQEQVEAELERFCRSVAPFYAAFGFGELSIALSTRPDSRAGDDADWDRAEALLERVVRRLELPWSPQAGAGAFYGPKLEFVLHDRLGRAWQCGTLQLDLAMPRSFDLRYVAAGGERRVAAMLHRALYGSLERFLGILLEHHGAALPAFLAPEQVLVLPIAAEHEAWGRAVEAELGHAGLRARLDARAESLARRIAEAHAAAVPLLAIVGAREVAGQSVTLRARDGQQTLPLAAARDELKGRCAMPQFGTLSPIRPTPSM
jgi:threonyl-tRNA synthetase